MAGTRGGSQCPHPALPFQSMGIGLERPVSELAVRDVVAVGDQAPGSGSVRCFRFSCRSRVFLSAG